MDNTYWTSMTRTSDMRHATINNTHWTSMIVTLGAQINRLIIKIHSRSMGFKGLIACAKGEKKTKTKKECPLVIRTQVLYRKSNENSRKSTSTRTRCSLGWWLWGTSKCSRGMRETAWRTSLVVRKDAWGIWVTWFSPISPSFFVWSKLIQSWLWLKR